MCVLLSLSAALMAEKQREFDFMLQQLLALRAMEQAEYEEKTMKAAAQQEHLDYLSQQIAEQQRDRAEWNKTKYGEIRGGFFEGFGKSCR